jgi:hypothetical protein
MTLLEIERLVRKISELLQQAGNPGIARKLAEDYASACHAVGLRLQQCEAMIKAGDRYQAIQLAETPPNLLESVSLLEFREADEWRGYCDKHGMPVAERVDAQAVQAIKDCYRQGIATNHPLYADYRRAVLSRSNEQALKALQSIARLNPGDANAASELSRLDAKVLSARLSRLDGILNSGQREAILGEIEAIESFGFKSRSDGEIWRKAMKVRCAHLLETSENLRKASRWMDVLANLDFIRRLLEEYKLEFPADWASRIEALEKWGLQEQEKDRTTREFQSLLGELHFRVSRSEEKDTSARYVELPEMKDDYEGLHKVWRSLQDFTRPIPDEASGRFRKRSALLETEIARRTAVRRRAIVAGALGVLIIGGGLSWFVLGQMRAHDFERQIKDAVARRQVHAAEKLLERLDTTDKRLMDRHAISEAAGAAQVLIVHERGLYTNFENSLTKLPKEFVGEATAQQLQKTADQLVATRRNLDALAPDFRAEAEPAVLAFNQRWERFLAESSFAANQLYSQKVQAAEAQSGQLNYLAPVENARREIATLSESVNQISDFEAGFTNYLTIRGDLLQQAGAVRAKFIAYQGELQKIDGGLGMLQKARSMKDYSDAMRVIAGSEFSSSTPVKAALAMQAMNPTEESALRNLLGATNRAVWAYVKKTQSTSFVPEVVMPAERKILQSLQSDPAIAAHHERVALWLDADGKNKLEWITTGPFDQQPVWSKILAYAPAESPNNGVFVVREYGFFDGQYRLSRTQPVSRIETIADLKDTASFYTVGVGKLLGQNGDSYTASLLTILDAIERSDEGSPIFRAYLFVRLTELMDLQPEAWGLSFAPAIAVQRAAITNLAGGPLQSGDWFVARKATDLAPILARLFSAGRNISFARQAQGLLALDREVAGAGLQYAGFVGMDGKSFLCDPQGQSEIWGYRSSRTEPVLLGQGNSALNSPADDAIFLSPLFATTAPRKKLLSDAGIKPDDPSFAGALPPMFAPRLDTAQSHR